MLRPALLTLSGKTYIVPGWREVPLGTSLKEVIDKWEKKNKPLRKEKINKFKVKGKPYIITLIDGKYFCNCPAGTYRKKCKHINAIREKNGVDKRIKSII